MCVKDMTKIIPSRIGIALGVILMSSIHGCLQQEASWIICALSIGVFWLSKDFPDNLGYIPSINSTCTPNNVSLSSSGTISSNHFSRE